MAKKIKTYIKLQINSGQANPSPPIGPSLGQHGINIMDFCKKFNQKTIEMEKGIPIPVIIKVYIDKSFSIKLKTPVTSFLIKKFANIKKGSSIISKTSGYISKDNIKKIAKIKFIDLTSSNMISAIKTIEGTAYSMGVKIKNR